MQHDKRQIQSKMLHLTKKIVESYDNYKSIVYFFELFLKFDEISCPDKSRNFKFLHIEIPLFLAEIPRWV